MLHIAPGGRGADPAYPQRVPSGARRVRVRIAVSARATLRVAGRRLRVGPAVRRVTVPLPSRRRAGVIAVGFGVRGRHHAALRGAIGVLRA